MKGKPKPFLRNSEIDELCERLIYEYMGDDGAEKPVDIIGFTTGFLKLTILYANIAEEDMWRISVQRKTENAHSKYILPKLNNCLLRFLTEQAEIVPCD